jgi:signal transduction histidine kinase
MADGKRLGQVFSNLIQNAIKSTPDGGQIRVVGRIIEDDNSQQSFIEITVSDTGVGIAAEDLERIFDKFYRVGNVLLHSTGNTKFKGAGPGLGLTIARGIIDAHGGRIWAESPGQDEETCPGAKFHVLLPVLRMEDVLDAAPNSGAKVER